jgi:hypothetical protein
MGKMANRQRHAGQNMDFGALSKIPAAIFTIEVRTELSIFIAFSYTFLAVIKPNNKKGG